MGPFLCGRLAHLVERLPQLRATVAEIPDVQAEVWGEAWQGQLRPDPKNDRVGRGNEQISREMRRKSS